MCVQQRFDSNKLSYEIIGINTNNGITCTDHRYPMDGDIYRSAGSKIDLPPDPNFPPVHHQGRVH